jgi:signal transduction histidine kinase/ActR/RegA family two-component response regulator
MTVRQKPATDDAPTQAAERAIAWIRVVAVLCAALIYFGLMRGKVGIPTRIADTLLVICFIFSLAVFWARRAGLSLRGYRAVLVAVCDGALALLSIAATGGVDSPFYPIIYICAVALSFRYRAPTAMLAAATYGLGYFALAWASGGLVGQEATIAARIAFTIVLAGLGCIVAESSRARTAQRAAAEHRESQQLAIARELRAANELLEKRIHERTAAAEAKASELEKSREQLRAAKERADDASRTKSAFLANMSHEIRTPLGIMLGFTDVLLEQSIDPTEQRTYLSRIRLAGDQLLALVNDILDLSKVEAGRLEIEMRPFSLSSLVEEVASLLSEQATARGLTLTVDTRPGVPDFVVSDRQRLRQILTNVIGNGIKFTEKGGIAVTLSSRPRAPDGIEIDFLVRDTGSGLSEAEAQRLFTPFIQADNSTTRRYGGTGLGLALSRRLARALGGDVELVQSAPGAGSTFRIVIAAGLLASRTAALAAASQMLLRRERDAGPADSPPRPLSGLHLLLVEDSPDNQILISTFLTLAGASVALAANGAEGVRQALAGSHDLILMDIQMPIMDGIQAMRRLRESGYDRPILAVTAHAMKEERERSLRLGFDDHVTKPIDRESLTRVILRQVDRSRSPMPPPPPESRV